MARLEQMSASREPLPQRPLYLARQLLKRLQQRKARLKARTHGMKRIGHRLAQRLLLAIAPPVDARHRHGASQNRHGDAGKRRGGYQPHASCQRRCRRNGKRAQAPRRANHPMALQRRLGIARKSSYLGHGKQATRSSIGAAHAVARKMPPDPAFASSPTPGAPQHGLRAKRTTGKCGYGCYRPEHARCFHSNTSSPSSPMVSGRSSTQSGRACHDPASSGERRSNNVLTLQARALWSYASSDT